MIQVPGEKPFVPQITPTEVKKAQQADETNRPSVPLPKGAEIGRGPEYDSQAIAVRLAALAMEAKEKELRFDEIIQRVIDMTGITNPEAAMEEASQRLQKEIETTLDEIKGNKDLMEEAQAWQDFAEVLDSKLSKQQVEAFFGIIKETIHMMEAKK